MPNAASQPWLHLVARPSLMIEPLNLRVDHRVVKRGGDVALVERIAHALGLGLAVAVDDCAAFAGRCPLSISAI